jgi:methylmalonyl-CoA mutase
MFSENDLFDEPFPPVSYGEWEELAKKIYKTSSIPTGIYPLDDITVNPLYTETDRDNRTSGLSAKRSMQLCQLIDSAGNSGGEALKNAVYGGAESLEIALNSAVLNGAAGADAQREGFGFLVRRYSDFAALIGGIDLEKIPIYIKGGNSASAIFVYLKRFAEESGFDLKRIKGAVEMDPLWMIMRFGLLPASIDLLYDEMAELLKWGDRHLSGVKTIGVNAACLNDAGASTVQELAYAAAAAVSYIRALLARNIELEHIISNIRFTLSLSSDFYLNTAKIAAMRHLWANLLAAFGGNGDAEIHCRTSQREKTRNDAHINIIRFTQQCLSAMVGGADTVTAAYFDKNDEFDRRISRNILLILKNEAKGTELLNSMQGSYFIDRLTIDLAEKSWSLFQQIEKNGGYYQELMNGTVQRVIKSVVKEREKRLKNGDDIMIGINAFREKDTGNVVKKENEFKGVEIRINKERITVNDFIELEDKAKKNCLLEEIYWKKGTFGGKKIEPIQPISLEKLF